MSLESMKDGIKMNLNTRAARKFICYSALVVTISHEHEKKEKCFRVGTGGT
jgi:hypothetical protein